MNKKKQKETPVASDNTLLESAEKEKPKKYPWQLPEGFNIMKLNIRSPFKRKVKYI